MYRKSFFLPGLMFLAAFLLVSGTGKLGFSQTWPYPSYGSVVGGVAIDAEGIVGNVSLRESTQLARELQKRLEAVPSELGNEVPLRKISLKKLNALLRDCRDNGTQLPESARYLGGLLSIHYVLLVPEENDILLIGPAEGWKVDASGTVVGQKSGAPILHLEDLITVFRAWNTQRPKVITCSIDPTPEGILEHQKVLNSDLRNGPRDAYYAALEDAMGLNVVTIDGVPGDSRFAQILFAADYRMKRIGMGQEASPIKNFPSYMSLIGANQKARSRFWLAPEYSEIRHDEKKLTWELTGVKVKALTENSLFDQRTGAREKSQVRDAAAEKWCENMTKRYDELGKAAPIFAELRNCMDIAVTVALIHQQGLLRQGKCNFDCFASPDAVKLPAYSVPKFVSPEVTTVSKARSTLVGCGGVEVNPFDAIMSAKTDSELEKMREKLAVSTGETWFAN